MRISNNLFRSRGFALIATISIMSLIVLISLALLSLSTVTTRTSSYSRLLQQAKANARVALAEAVSNLQMEVGPDQRITSWSNILDDTEATDAITGVLHPRYLGVWDSWNTYINEEMTTSDGSKIHIGNTYQKGRHEKLFRRWLVSHVDESSFTTLNSVQTGGVTWAADGSDSVALVAGGSLGPSVAASEHIRAGLVPVGSSGKYAWWVGSESMKASLGSYTDAPVVKVPEDVQVVASELTHFSVEPLGSGYSSFPSTSTTRDKFISRDTIALGTSISAGDDPKKYLYDHYWDVTHNSTGLLTDVRRGGTKYCLNLLFELDSPPAGSTTGHDPSLNYHEMVVGNVTADMSYRDFTANKGTLPSPQNPHIFPSGWRHLREYYRLYRSASGYPSYDNAAIKWSSGIPYTRPYLASDLGGWYSKIPEVNFYPRLPVLKRFMYIVGLRSRAVGGDPSIRDLYITTTPVVVYWNPYNIEMRFNPNSFVFNAAFNKGLWLESRVREYGATPTDTNWQRMDQRNGADVTPEEGLMDLEIHGDPSGTAEIVIKPGALMMFTPHSGTTQRAHKGFDTSLATHDAGAQVKVLSSVAVPALAADNPKMALRFGTQPNVNAFWPENHYYWGMDRSGMTLVLRERELGEGVHNADGSESADIPNAYGTYSIGGLAIDWLEDADNYTEILPLDDSSMPAWDMGSEDVIPVGVISWEVKTSEDLVYTSNASPPAGTDDFRSKNWLHATPVNMINYLQNPTDLKRSFFPYRMHYADATGAGLGDLVQVDGADAYGGPDFSAGGDIKSVIAQELPTAPITSLASFASMPLVPARAKSLDSTYISGIPAAYSNNASWKMVAHTGAVFGLGIGNGYAHSMIPGDQLYYNDGTVDPLTTKSIYSDYWDNLTISNDALWDRYFCSSIVPRVSEGATTKSLSDVASEFYTFQSPLYNSRLKPYFGGESPNGVISSLVNTTTSKPALDGFVKAGAHLTVDGAFNINSTSVKAWKMMLHGLKNRELPYYNEATATHETITDNSTALISRSRRVASDQEGLSPTNDPAAWNGIRKLTDAQLDRLAEEMVRQVKLRGPFLNMSDFINRRLSTGNLGVSSALQSAIDWDEFNEGYDGTFDTSDPAESINRSYKTGADHMIATPTATYPNMKAARGSRYAGIAGYVMASDILQGLGNVITPRCDTFTVRAYGEASDGKGNTVKVWLEAVVQRTPDYVDSSDDNWEAPSTDFGADSGAVSALNKELGRKMKIISQRWLKEEEL